MKPILIITFLLISFSPILSQDLVEKTTALIQEKKYSEAIDFARKQSLKMDEGFEKARLLQLTADAYYYVNDISTSLSYYLLSESIYEEIEDESLMYHEAIGHTGFCYRELGQLDMALVYYKKALEMAYSLNEESEIASDHANLGTVYARIGDLEKANSNFLKAYTIDVNRKDTSAIGFDLRNLAEMQMLIGNYKLAKDHIFESIHLLANSSGNANSMALRLSALGNSYVAMQMYDSAKYYLEKSALQLIELGDTLNTINNWISVARLEFKLRKYENSISQINKALYYIDEHNLDNTYRLQTQELLTDVYIATKEFSKAKPLINKNIQIAKEQGLLSSLRNVYRQLALVEEKQSNYLGALNAQKIFTQLNDSILNSESQKNIQELNVLYQVDQLDQKNEILKLETAVAKAETANREVRLRWIIFASIMTILGILVISWIYFSKQKLKNRLLSTEVDQLRNQIKLAVEGNSSAVKLEIQAVNQQLNSPLTEREFEILSYAITDMSNGEIADKVFVSVNTVKYHLKNIYDKIGASNRKEALKFALNLNH